jgi:hypothetical protein
MRSACDPSGHSICRLEAQRPTMGGRSDWWRNLYAADECSSTADRNDLAGR